ncbi:sensor histidine kinase [Caldanaerobius polysaccharolyticus]|uniref:sensor histidine kinase n=1 Tax=Caldanaerobius polysaccharolyticus TaxID=44256 RepID=UPI00047D3EF0|nr:histidine kinase [Caldanaerobius polysaccharolyticus]
MSFQKRLLLTYYLFTVFLVIVLEASFYKHSITSFEKNAYSNLAVISQKMSQQLDNRIRSMEFITTNLLSNQNFISSMACLITVDRNNPKNSAYIDEARRTISILLTTYSIDRNFYRVSVFNNKGDFLTSNFRTNNVSENLLDLINRFKWKSRVDRMKGKALILTPYVDPWAKYNPIKVYGLVRAVQWPRSGMGYIEVQQPYSELKKLFAVPDESSTRVIAVTGSGEIFYDSGITDSALLNYYSHLATKVTDFPFVKKNTITGKNEVVIGTNSDYTGIKVIIVQDRAALLKPFLFTRNMTITSGIVIIIISFVYMYIFSRQLTRPIKELKEKMEHIELQNLPEQINIESSSDEIAALNKAFQRLRERLNDAVQQEIKSHWLQMQASFDSLQSQVNPHFIYNILNVLSNKGIENGDDEICEICDSIASMLRYSTSTKKRSATIGEELDHVRNYLLLMKKRFEHMLEFSIDVDDAICREEIPKIVLQPIVENSINHGFTKERTIMKIKIEGYLSNGWWYIKITDNGQGFDPDVLNDLEKKIKNMKAELGEGKTKTSFAIGGMGLVNTFGRLALFYNNKFVFHLGNIPTGGAQVTIGGPTGLKKECDNNG